MLCVYTYVYIYIYIYSLQCRTVSRARQRNAWSRMNGSGSGIPPKHAFQSKSPWVTSGVIFGLNLKHLWVIVQGGSTANDRIGFRPRPPRGGRQEFPHRSSSFHLQSSLRELNLFIR